MKIKQWNDIKQEFKDSLLLGNGASVAIDGSFSYKSLKQHAIDEGYFTSQVQTLFSAFHTEDFELILRIVWHAYHVNDVLGISDDKTKEAYEAVRDTLISSVRSIHCQHDDATKYFKNIYSFSKNFKTVCSLNYDLTLYWVAMYGNDISDGHMFKDCFNGKSFDDDWQRFREPIYQQRKCTLFFYPHGNLVFARDKIENEVKIRATTGNALLESILEKWENGSYIPLFVSEGTSDQKLKSIQSSYYLNTVYREVLTDINETLVIYGWGLGEHDLHIINRICSGGTRKFAVSVFPDGKEEAYCNRASQIIKDACNGEEVQIEFFCTTSEECWINA